MLLMFPGVFLEGIVRIIVCLEMCSVLKEQTKISFYSRLAQPDQERCTQDAFMQILMGSNPIPRTRYLGNSNLSKTQRIFAEIMQNPLSKVH